MNQPSQMFTEFKPITKEEWLLKIEKDLKGQPISNFDIEMGGVNVGAFHVKAAESQLAVPISGNAGWGIGEDFFVNGNLGAVNRQVLESLENGVTAPRFILNQMLSINEMEVLFKGVDLGIISIHFIIENQAEKEDSFLQNFVKYAVDQGVKPSDLSGSIHVENAALQSQMLSYVVENNFSFKVLTVNGVGLYSESDTVTELAEMLMAGERLISKFTSENRSVQSINSHLFFSLAVGKNYFLQIAKIRALKLLWFNVLKAYGVTVPSIYIDSHIHESTLVEDPNTNKIAATTQAMAAVIGGVDRLTILPSDAHQEDTSGSFSLRIARNVQHILQQESYMTFVQDPGAGSYFIEELTQKIALGAWAVFQNGK